MNIGGIERTLFEGLYEGILIIDREYKVKYINPSYTRITGITEDEILDKLLKEVRPGARLVDVVKTGEPIVGALRNEQGADYLVNMSPLMENGEIVGGISVVSDVEDVKKLSRTISRYESDIKKLENRIRVASRAKYTMDDIISADDISLKVKKELSKQAKKDISIILMGESGVGKELYAQAIHNASLRLDGPFIAVNCAAFQNELLDSELFGYEEGAFTGAKKGGKMGLFEAANHGTIFLDEISEMSMETQGRLLRTLQEKTVRRVGGIEEIPVDIRVIAATNKNLEKLIEEGKFRQDLYYRIAVYPVLIPPLRSRKKDIPAIANYYVEEQKNVIKRNLSISDEAMDVLMAYDWPGNIRELKNAVEYSANSAEGEIIGPENLPARMMRVNEDGTGALSVRKLTEVSREAEAREIRKAIKIFGDDLEGKRKAAQELGISLASLYNKIKL